MRNHLTVGCLIAVAIGLTAIGILHGQEGFRVTEVRRLSDMSTPERIALIFRNTFTFDGALRDVAPLYAYDPGPMCQSPDSWHQDVGPSAIVVEGSAPPAIYAYYHPTLTATVESALTRWCERDERTWYIATTYPVEGKDAVEKFVSMEGDGIAALR